MQFACFVKAKRKKKHSISTQRQQTKGVMRSGLDSAWLLTEPRYGYLEKWNIINGVGHEQKGETPVKNPLFLSLSNTNLTQE